MAETNHNRKPSGMNSRPTARESIRLSLEEEDDYDLAAMGISDGFRPTTNVPAGHNRMSSHSSHRERRSTPPPRPSSMTKPRNLDTFALRHDGATGVSNRPTTIASSSGAGSITRSSSVSTDNPFIRPESPYQGPTGPSHPYHMYPQNTRLARTASIATTSTNPGPTHPYRMYPQNTIPETENIPDSIPASSIPVGFPGHGGDYQRRLGPDGEEAADIIGPLGHTEQLPPYTKYPEEAFARKVAPGLPHIAGAGGIGLATRDPEFASREDLNSPLSRQSHRSLTSDSDNQINVAAFTVSEKPPDKKWKIIARRKVWGIVPVWVFVLVALIFLGFILILSTVLKIFMHHMPPSPKPSPDSAGSATMYTTVTTTYDALSLSSVPTGMPTLPTGTYSLSIATPSVSHQSCLDTTSLYSAWSCALPLDSIDVSISPLVGGSKTGCYKIKIGSSDMPTGYNYGTQPPVIASEQILNLVNDTQQSQWGPAWYFEAAYDKLVVVPENALPPYNAKRDDDDHDNDNDLSRKGIAQTGDTPWFCFWNNTVLETFIYVNQTSRSGAQQASVSAASAPMATSTGATQGSYGSAYPTQPTASNGMQSSRTTTASSATTSQANYDNTVPGMLEDYPKVVKVEERRIPVGSRLPYCQKMVIQLDGSAVPALNSQGSEMFIYLNETEPALPAPSAKRSLPGTELVQRQTSQLCQCVWYSL